MILSFSTLAEAYAVPDPKLVQITRAGILVFTGADIPPPPQPQPEEPSA